MENNHTTNRKINLITEQLYSVSIEQTLVRYT